MESVYERPIPELKPCPFCGEKPKFISGAVERGGIYGRFHLSLKCKCGVEVRLGSDRDYIDISVGQDGSIYAMGTGRVNLAEKWNRRAE